MDDKATLQRYLSEITRDPTSYTRYTSNTRWTAFATTALIETGLARFPRGERAARGNQDRHGRSEYLTLDVCLTDPDTWGAPLFVAEHENYPGKAKVQYCAWKLLSTDASVRMLVAYFGKGTEFTNFADLRSAVAEVVDAQPPDKAVLLVGGDYAEKPKRTEELRRAHEAEVVRRQDRRPRRR